MSALIRQEESEMLKNMTLRPLLEDPCIADIVTQAIAHRDLLKEERAVDWYAHLAD